MKLIIDIVLVCHLLATSVCYNMIYGNMHKPHGYMDNHIQHHQLPNYDSEYADSKSEFQSSQIRQSHHHHRNTRLRSEQFPAHRCSGSRSSVCKNTCKKCQTKHSPTFLPGFPAEFPTPFPFPYPEVFPPQFPSPFPQPDVIVLPYPIPVMVMPPMASKTLITESLAQPTASTTQVPPTTAESTKSPETTTLTPESTALTSTIPPWVSLNIDGTTKNKFAKRFKIMTIKTYRRKGNNHDPDLNFNRKLPKYGIVRIPESLAMRLMQQLKNENKALLKNQKKLYDVENERQFRFRP